MEQAILSENYNRLHDLLRQGAPIVSKDHNYSALICAVRQGNLSIVKLLCQYATTKDFAFRDYDDKNALDIFCRYSSCDSEIIKILIDKTPDINEKDRAGRTALEKAISSDNIEAMSQLLNSDKIDVNTQNKTSKATILMLFFDRLYFKCVDKDKYKQLIEKTRVLDILIEKSTTNIIDENGNTALHYATRLKDTSIHLLLQDT